ncbi:MAG TPA: ABC-2 transporter permease [Thermoanaerobaculia bacterium]
MNGSLVRQLILKDLYLMRWMIAGSIVAGLVSIVMMPLGTVSAYVGGVSLICVLVILNIFLALTNVVQERKEKVMLFVLSLPVSTTEYTIAKALANFIAFAVPWTILTIANVVVIDVSSMPNGILPFWIAILGYLLSYFCALLALTLVKDGTGWHTTAIVVGNVSVNFVIPFLLSRPSVTANAKGNVAVWTSDLVAFIAIEILAGLAALGVAVFVQSRRRDFI